MIAEGNRDKVKDIKDEDVYQIGKLTLTRYNLQLSSISFEKK